MSSETQDPWQQLAIDVENACNDINVGRMERGNPPIAFDLDGFRRMCIVLRDRRRPVPSFTADQMIALRWNRRDGFALAVFTGHTIELTVKIADRRTDSRIKAWTTDDVVLDDFLSELDHFTPLKQVILIRRDLKMRQGKSVSQGSHSSGEFMREQLLAALEGRPLTLSSDEIEWMTCGMAKITLRTDSPEQFEAVVAQAQQRGLKTRVITDSGKTEFGGVPTVTTVAIGPTRSAYVDDITGKLTLL